MRFLLRFYFVFAASCAVLSAKIVFDSKTIEVQVKPGQDMVTGFFPFKIVDEEETIVKAEVFCMCLEPQVPLNPDRSPKLNWKVGEKGVIKGRFSTKQFLGTVEKSIEVTMKGHEKPVMLNFRVVIPELIKLEPATLKWDKGSKAEERVIKITVNHDKPIKIVSHQGNNDKVFPYEFKTIKEGQEYEVRIKPTSTEQSGMGMISLRTDSEFPRFKRKVIYAVVRPKTTGKPVNLK